MVNSGAAYRRRGRRRAPLATVLMSIIWKVVSSAVNNSLYWLMHTFDNERAEAGRNLAGDLAGRSVVTPRITAVER